MVTYRITETDIIGGDGAPYMSFGIALFRGSERLRTINDISADRTAVQRLADLFNAEELDPVHFDQAVEDFLYDFEI